MNITRNRIGSVLAVTVLIALTGCTGDAGAPDTAPTPGVSTSDPTSTPTDDPTSTPTTPVPTITAGPDGQYDYCDAQTTPFTGDAADEFGAKKVMDAYCTYVEFSMEQSFISNLMRSGPEDLTAADFQFWLEYMTPDARADWEAAVKKSLSGDDIADDSAVWALSYYDAVNGTGYSFTDDTVVRNQEFSAARTHVDTSESRKRLGLTFTVSADLNVLKDGTKDEFYLIPMSKEITYYLVEDVNPRHPWVIDGWYATFNAGEPQKNTSK